jgi:hypothetical protein
MTEVAQVTISAEEARRLQLLAAWATHRSKPDSEIRVAAITCGRLARRATHTLTHPRSSAARSQEAPR